MDRLQGRLPAQPWKDRQWDAVGYIHSSKRALLACIEAKGLKLSAASRAALSRQGDRIWRWRTHADGVRQIIGTQVEGGRYPVPGLAAKSAGRDMAPTQKLEALV